MDYSIYKIYDTPEENAKLFEKIVLVNHVYNICVYKRQNDENLFYGTVENFSDKCSTLFNKSISKEEFINNWIFYTRFSFPIPLLEEFFKDQLDDILNIVNDDLFNSTIIIDPKKLTVKITENRKSTYRRFVTPKCFIIDKNTIEKICANQQLVKNILDLNSKLYTTKESVLLKMFTKKRNQYLKEFYKKDEKINLTKTKIKQPK